MCLYSRIKYNIIVLHYYAVVACGRDRIFVDRTPPPPLPPNAKCRAYIEPLVKEGTTERAVNNTRTTGEDSSRNTRLVRLRTCISSFIRHRDRSVQRASEFLLLYPSAVAVWLLLLWGFSLLPKR